MPQQTWPGTIATIYSTNKQRCCTNLQRVENPRRSLENAVDAVGNMEAMSPVMISNCSVVLLHSDEEPYLGKIAIRESLTFVTF